ncbi:Maff2 family protein [Butyrivibrio fibrisolvens DSM 3071]|uniref:Maff2 family protein n=1 Tax=Butyrivibrio fibrisolvens DSM 3071 TaxID=1121131 RepID=A0A1M5TV28_BUTFI|nr:Maff2 family protein [Butyrivibrio fibrisolvens DSM 3071]
MILGNGIDIQYGGLDLIGNEAIIKRVWGVVNLLEGYGNDNPGAKSQGMKQLMAGGV